MESKNKRILIYGAYGYTGLLILEDSIKKGVNVVISGRNEAKCSQLAKKHNVPYVVFALTQSDAQIDEQLRKADVIAVMNCAGPFSETFGPMSAACIRNGLHYLDVTGEISVFEQAHSLDSKAKDAKIMLMPGTGNDVVPSDCLAARLKKRLPTATELNIGMCITKKPKGKNRDISHGTMTTVVNSLGKPNVVRRDAKIVPTKYLEKKFLVPREKEGEYIKAWGTTVSWGDVSTAYYSTGIPNIAFYAQIPPIARWFFWLFSLSFMKWILGSNCLQKFFTSRIPEGGPTPEYREETRVGFFGEAIDYKNGKVAVSFLRSDEGYKITHLASVAIMKKVIGGDAPAGFRTPSLAYGADFITQIEGATTSFEDLEIEAIPKQ